MIPLIICSILALAISIERFIRLKRDVILPKNLVNEVLLRSQSENLSMQDQQELFKSALGKILQKGFNNTQHCPQQT